MDSATHDHIPLTESNMNNKQQENETNDAQKSAPEQYQARICSTMKVKHKSRPITVIILRNDASVWIATTEDKCLTLVSKDGDTIKESVSVGGEIMDAKQCHEDILVTHYQGHKLIKLSANGDILTVFHDFGSFLTQGLWVTSGIDILICLTSKTGHRESRVTRLGLTGNVLQTIQFNSVECLCVWPYKVTALPTGEILILDSGKVICIDGEGKHLFTWRGEVEGIKIGKFRPCSITYDNKHNLFVTDYVYQRVYMVGKDGSFTKCLLDKTKGLMLPWGIDFDNNGHLLVGCFGGKILTINLELYRS